ncbi:MAG: NrfD/PsrC family molybdoenzyme membrane anchor subunit [bacterium]
MDKRIFRPTGWNVLALILVIFGLILTVVRYTKGLGAVTNLTDWYPWGFWIAFDVMSGVALAAGGFVIAGIVHIFNLKRYKPIVRPAILTAFLGYFLVIVGLLVDLGRPWFIYHAIIMPQVHSVMLEVAMCVFFYFIVLFLEFLPIYFQGVKQYTAYKALYAISIPLVIIGIMLSTLHQSSLGGLLLLAKEQLNPLWYSSALPFNFFLSAVAAGFGMVILESQASSKTYGRAPENDILGSLSKGAGIILAVYFIWRMIDISMNGGWKGLSAGYEAGWFWVEIILGVVVPCLFLLGPGRTNPGIRQWGAILTVFGVVLNRINATLTGMITGTGYRYFPSWQEIFISLAIVCAGLLIFQAIVQMLPIFDPEVKEAEAAMAAAGA